MKLHKIKLVLIAILLFILTSCGINISSTINHQNDQVITPNKTSNNENDNKEEMADSIELVRIQEQKLSYRINNVKKEETAFLKYNDNQSYSMYVLPNYELITEEPFRDILYLNKNDSIFMRIELLPNDINWSDIKESTDFQLSAISNTNLVRTPLKDEFLEKSAVHEARNAQDVVTVYFINDQNIKLKLTMFTNHNEDHRNAFFQMAKTILKESS